MNSEEEKERSRLLKHFILLETRIAGPTDRRTDIARYKAAIAANKMKWQKIYIVFSAFRTSVNVNLSKSQIKQDSFKSPLYLMK